MNAMALNRNDVEEIVRREIAPIADRQGITDRIIFGTGPENEGLLTQNALMKQGMKTISDNLRWMKVLLAIIVLEGLLKGTPFGEALLRWGSHLIGLL